MEGFGVFIFEAVSQGEVVLSCEQRMSGLNTIGVEVLSRYDWKWYW